MRQIFARVVPRIPSISLPTVVAVMAISCSTGGDQTTIVSPQPLPAPPLAQLAILVQPGDSVESGAAMSPAVQVAIQDALGHTITTDSSPVSISLWWEDPENGIDGTLSGTLTERAVNGVATFSDLSVDLAGPGYMLVATAYLPTLTAAGSKPFAVVPGAPAALLFLNGDPPDVTAGTRIGALYVYITDVNGNATGTASNAITLAITAGSGASGAVLGGTLTQIALNGVATFDDLTIDRPGVGYSLTATATGLNAVRTSSFSVR